MFYREPSSLTKAKLKQKAEIDKINNQKIANKVQVYANAEIDKVVMFQGEHKYQGMQYNNPNTLKDLISINKPKIDKEYNKVIKDKKTSNSTYHQIQVQKKANEKTIQISKLQKDRLENNIKSVEKVLKNYEVNIDKYKELNKKYPKTESRKGIITESIMNKNFITSMGYNIKPHFDGYKELSHLTEGLHRQAQNQSQIELAQAQNEEAALNGQDPPNTHKTWVWTGEGKTTRHFSNNGQTVPIDEKFTIVNDSDGQVDLMDYPLDPSVYSSNGFICYCEVEYHNNDDKQLTMDFNPSKVKFLDNLINLFGSYHSYSGPSFPTHESQLHLQMQIENLTNKEGKNPIPKQNRELAAKLIMEYSKHTELDSLPIYPTYKMLMENYLKEYTKEQCEAALEKLKTNENPTLKDVMDLVEKQLDLIQVMEGSEIPEPEDILLPSHDMEYEYEKSETFKEIENILDTNFNELQLAEDGYGINYNLRLLQEDLHNIEVTLSKEDLANMVHYLNEVIEYINSTEKDFNYDSHLIEEINTNYNKLKQVIEKDLTYLFLPSEKVTLNEIFTLKSVENKATGAIPLPYPYKESHEFKVLENVLKEDYENLINNSNNPTELEANLKKVYDTLSNELYMFTPSSKDIANIVKFLDHITNYAEFKLGKELNPKDHEIIVLFDKLIKNEAKYDPNDSLHQYSKSEVIEQYENQAEISFSLETETMKDFSDLFLENILEIKSADTVVEFTEKLESFDNKLQMEMNFINLGEAELKDFYTFNDKILNILNEKTYELGMGIGVTQAKNQHMSIVNNILAQKANALPEYIQNFQQSYDFKMNQFDSINGGILGKMKAKELVDLFDNYTLNVKNKDEGDYFIEKGMEMAAKIQDKLNIPLDDPLLDPLNEAIKELTSKFENKSQTIVDFEVKYNDLREKLDNTYSNSIKKEIVNELLELYAETIKEAKTPEEIDYFIKEGESLINAIKYNLQLTEYDDLANEQYIDPIKEKIKELKKSEEAAKTPEYIKTFEESYNDYLDKIQNANSFYLEKTNKKKIFKLFEDYVELPNSKKEYEYFKEKAKEILDLIENDPTYDPLHDTLIYEKWVKPLNEHIEDLQYKIDNNIVKQTGAFEGKLDELKQELEQVSGVVGWSTVTTKIVDLYVEYSSKPYNSPEDFVFYQEIAFDLTKMIKNKEEELGLSPAHPLVNESHKKIKEISEKLVELENKPLNEELNELNAEISETVSEAIENHIDNTINENKIIEQSKDDKEKEKTNNKVSKKIEKIKEKDKEELEKWESEQQTLKQKIKDITQDLDALETDVDFGGKAEVEHWEKFNELLFKIADFYSDNNNIDLSEANYKSLEYLQNKIQLMEIDFKLNNNVDSSNPDYPYVVNCKNWVEKISNTGLLMKDFNLKDILSMDIIPQKKYEKVSEDLIADFDSLKIFEGLEELSAYDSAKDHVKEYMYLDHALQNTLIFFDKINHIEHKVDNIIMLQHIKDKVATFEKIYEKDLFFNEDFSELQAPKVQEKLDTLIDKIVNYEFKTGDGFETQKQGIVNAVNKAVKELKENDDWHTESGKESALKTLDTLNKYFDKAAILHEQGFLNWNEYGVLKKAQNFLENNFDLAFLNSEIFNNIHDRELPFLENPNVIHTNEENIMDLLDRVITEDYPNTFNNTMLQIYVKNIDDRIREIKEAIEEDTNIEPANVEKMAKEIADDVKQIVEELTFDDIEILPNEMGLLIDKVEVIKEALNRSIDYYRDNYLITPTEADVAYTYIAKIPQKHILLDSAKTNVENGYIDYKYSTHLAQGKATYNYFDRFEPKRPSQEILDIFDNGRRFTPEQIKSLTPNEIHFLMDRCEQFTVNKMGNDYRPFAQRVRDFFGVEPVNDTNNHIHIRFWSGGKYTETIRFYLSNLQNIKDRRFDLLPDDAWTSTTLNQTVKIKDYIRQLLRMTKETKIKSAFISYRGQGSFSHSNTEVGEDFKFQDRFTSTSITEYGTEIFSHINEHNGHTEGRAFFTILNPANASGYYIDGQSKYEYETEVITNPDCDYQILAYDELSGTMLLYRVLENEM